MTTKDIGPKNPVAKAGEAAVDYVEDRTGARTGLRWFLFRNIPAETSWFQTLGFAAMAVFGLQAITGIFLAMYYKPEATTAYDSIRHITEEVTWGWLVRGMHKWGATAMIVIVFLHMGRVFIFGAYKYPRELTWVTGAILLIMTMFMGLTGYLLVWDEKAYWATVVAINITASAPILGPYVADVLRAGPEMGPDTLSRFYSIHMLVIPGGMATFIGIHLFLVAKLGIAEPPWSKRAYRARRAEEEARRAAARERLPYGRREVSADPATPETVTAGSDS
ncbi:MAG TPA: cytochrome b N-terminal domain-containing protein [Miltoncostaeaceae bacterium]|nr:cytochrome b N-terminal domain-containing protein [Miltoncostaeaceae bacterium]